MEKKTSERTRGRARTGGGGAERRLEPFSGTVSDMAQEMLVQVGVQVLQEQALLGCSASRWRGRPKY